MTQTRMKNGFLQIKFEGDRRWKYIIYGFGDNDCRVATGNNTYTDIPIDENNRITINGRKYGPSFWYH